MTARPKICVFAASSLPKADSPILEATRRLGQAIGDGGFDLIYVGSLWGLLGEIATEAHKAGASVTAVIPEQWAAEKQLAGVNIENAGSVQGRFCQDDGR